MSVRLVILTSVLVGVCAVFLMSDYFTDHREVLLRSLQDVSVQIWSLWGQFAKSVVSQGTEVILTKDQLSQYDGMKGSKGLYLAILGKVFDVSKGAKHYGPGGGYHFFTGKDASRAFVSGDFKPKGLTDDVTKLGPKDVLGLEEWLSFYERDYIYVGKVSGTFYNSKGEPTKSWLQLQADLKQARKVQAAEKEDAKLFPPCNSEWKQNVGGRLWCSSKSGGTERNWVGVPRLYHKPGSRKPRCACVRVHGPPSGHQQGASHNNRGDLDNPNLKEYSNCPSDSDSCPLPADS